MIGSIAVDCTYTIIHDVMRSSLTMFSLQSFILAILWISLTQFYNLITYRSKPLGSTGQVSASKPMIIILTQVATWT